MTDEFQNAFISYGRIDSKAFVIKLHQRLTGRNLKVWFDQNDIPLAVDFQDQINDGIQRSDNFLFIISPHAVNSPYCLKEIEFALQANKRIIPLLHVEQISYETWQQRHPNGTDAEWATYQAKGLHTCFANMHPAIARINWVYFREGIDDYESSLTGLLATFERHQIYVRQHTFLLTQALEWERHQKQSRYLLIGEERQQAETWLQTRFEQEQAPCLPTDLHCEFITESIKNANNLMTQVFLAHAEEDNAVANQICRSLMREGFTVWTSQTDIQTGSAFQEAINRGIEEADNIVYLLSPDSLRSQYCRFEIDYGRSLNKRIIPLLARETNPNEIPDDLRGLQYIDLTDNTAAADYLRDESQLLRILRQDAAYYAEHKMLLTKALKWQRQNRNPSILLRGYNLSHSEAWLKVAKQRHRHPPTPLQEAFITESLRQPPGGSLDVFVSYSRTDSDFARHLNDALQIQGKRTWFDQESIASGTDFQQEIDRGIETSDHFLFILSPSSIHSPYCASEVEYAQKLNKRIVTVLHRPVNPAELHPGLAAVQWIDFNQREGDFSTSLSQLLRSLDTDRDHLNTHTRLLVRAIEWDTAGRKDSLLLRGDDLERSEQWLTQSQQKQPQPTELHASYIHTSRTAEAASQRATQILQAAAAKGKQRVLIGTTVMVIGLAVAGIAGAIAYWADGQAKTARQQATDAQAQATQAQTQVTLAEQREQQAQVRLTQATTAVQAAERKRQTAEQQVKLAEQRLKTAAVKTAQAEQQLQQAQRQVQVAQVSLQQAQVARTAAQTAQKEAQAGTLLERVSSTALKQFEVQQLEGLLTAIQAGQQLSAMVGDRPLNTYPAFSPLLALQTILDSIREVNRVQVSQGQLVTVSFMYGDRLATVDQNGTLRLLNPNGRAQETLNLGQKPLWSASFSPDGKQIAAISQDGTLHLWTRNQQVKQLQAIRKFKVSGKVFASVSFSPDGNQIATLGKRGILSRWSLDGQLLSETQTGGSNLSFSPDGQTIATAGKDRIVRLWSIAKLNSQKPELEFNAQQSVLSIRFSPDGQTLATGGQNGTVRLWNLDGQQVDEFKTRQSFIVSLDFSPEGSQLAVADSDGSISLWNLASRSLPELATQQKSVSGIQFSPDGQQLLTTGETSSIKIWSLSGHKPTLQTELPVPQQNVVGVSLSRDGKTIAIVTDAGIVQLYSRAGKRLTSFNSQQASYNLDFSPDGKQLVTTGIKGAFRWSLRGDKLAEIAPGEVYNASFSADGQRILTAQRKQVTWRTLDGKPGTPLIAHDGKDVLSVAVSPDGERFATASDDGTVRLWNRDNNLLAEYRLPKAILSLSFSPDGKQIAVGDGGGTVRFISVETLPELLARGCRWLKLYQTSNHDDSTLCAGGDRK